MRRTNRGFLIPVPPLGPGCRAGGFGVLAVLLAASAPSGSPGPDPHPANGGSLEGPSVEVQGLAGAILRDYDRLDVLINNPGVWLDGPDERELTPDGHEVHFQVNHLHLVTSPGLESGGYFNGLSPARAHEQAHDEEARQALRRLSEELAGLR